MPTTGYLLPTTDLCVVRQFECLFLEHVGDQSKRRGKTEQDQRPNHDAEYYSSVRGFSVQSLIKNCWLVRHDLDSEDDRKFIERLKEPSYSCVKRRQLRKLLACARDLGEIEQYVSIDG